MREAGLGVVGGLALLALLPLTSAAASDSGPAPGTTEVITIALGVDEQGVPSRAWLALLARRLDEAAVAEAAALRRPPTVEERAWELLIRRRVSTWLGGLPELVAPFAPLAAPREVTVVLGNRSGEDAFTHDPVTIGFDLGKLAALYGDATSDENRDRIDRLFAHEYTHLLQKAWFPEHPQPMATPLERAELEIWTEGQGNYRSLSAKWRADRGVPTPLATETLERLEPRFVERMTALACASPEEASELTADLSNGPFTEKWGALVAALWLESDMSTDPQALRRFVQGGVGEVRALARRHLAPDAFAAFESARERSRSCGGSATAAATSSGESLAAAAGPPPAVATPEAIGAATGQRVVARLEQLHWNAHEEWLDNGDVWVSNVAAFAVVHPEPLGELLFVHVAGHPHVGDRPVLIGGLVTFLLPANWQARDLSFDDLGGLTFYEAKQAAP